MYVDVDPLRYHPAVKGLCPRGRPSIISYQIPYILVRVIFPFPFVHVSHHGFTLLSRQYCHFSAPSVKTTRQPDGHMNEDK